MSVYTSSIEHSRRRGEWRTKLTPESRWTFTICSFLRIFPGQRMHNLIFGLAPAPPSSSPSESESVGMVVGVYMGIVSASDGVMGIAIWKGKSVRSGRGRKLTYVHLHLRLRLHHFRSPLLLLLPHPLPYHRSH